MTLPEQTGEIAVRCQVGRLQGTLFRIKPVPLSFWVTASIYSTFTVFQTTAKTEREIITFLQQNAFRFFTTECTNFIQCSIVPLLEISKGWFPILLNTLFWLAQDKPIHTHAFANLFLSRQSQCFFSLKAAVSKEMSVLFFQGF